MNRNPVLLYKMLVVGVIVLFIGVGIQPAIATVQKEEIDIVQAPPEIFFEYEILGDNLVNIWVMAIDETSGMDRLEIYFNGKLKEIFYGHGDPIIDELIMELRYPPVPFIIIKAVAYDTAGNRAEASLNLREVFDLNRHSDDNFSNNYLQNDFFNWLIDRFLLLEVLLRIIEILR